MNRYPRLQLRAVKELMERQGIERPSTVAATDETFKKALESKKSNTSKKRWDYEPMRAQKMIAKPWRQVQNLQRYIDEISVTLKELEP